MRVNKRSAMDAERWSVASVVRKALKWLGAIIVGSFVAAIFQDAANACSMAVSNASTGLWAKFIDTYYIRAAQSEITDCATQCAIFASMTLVCVYGMATGYFGGRLRGIREALRWMARQSKKEKRSSVEEYKKDCERSIVMIRFVIVISILFCLAYTYVVSLNVCSYRLLRDYSHTMRRVSNVIDTDKRLEVDGMWVRMRTQSDYRKIQKLLDAWLAESDAAWSNRVGRTTISQH